MGFDVKIVKDELREDGRGLKQVSHKKPFKKLFQDVLRLDESQGSVAKIFASHEWVAKAFGWTRDWGFATGESPAESWKTLTPIF